MKIVLAEGATLPTRGSDGACGYDLSSNQNITVKAKDRALIETGVAISLPAGYRAKLESRSGLAWRHKVDVKAGTIDEDYTGFIKVLLHNESDVDFEVKQGDRIAQMVIQQYSVFDFEVVEELPRTKRDANGFGSTGVSKVQKQE